MNFENQCTVVRAVTGARGERLVWSRDHASACIGVLTALMFLLAPRAPGQETVVFREDFDAAVPPSLPAGWSSTRNRAPASDDFQLAASLPYSVPNAILSTNATIAQSLLSPEIPLPGIVPAALSFFVRRSPSHAAALIVEASTDGGASFAGLIGDTLRGTGEASYVAVSFPVPLRVAGAGRIRFRWRIIADTAGSSGTIRIDDVVLAGRALHDLALRRLSLVGDVETGKFRGEVAVANVGLEEAAGFELALFLDSDRDSLAEPGERVGGGMYDAPLAPTDSVVVQIDLAPPAPGEWRLIAEVSYAGDQIPENNRGAVDVHVPFRSGSLLVNEIMFSPLRGGSEYVELINPGPDPLDICGWAVGIGSPPASTRRILPLVRQSRTLGGGRFALVAADSEILRRFPRLTADTSSVVQVAGQTSLGLNNSGDDVVLLDPSGHTIDSVAFSPAWHNPGLDDPAGRSLEKIHPLLRSNDRRSWSTCVDASGGTPAEQNSVFALSLPSLSAISCSPNPFSPDGDGREDVTVVSYRLPLTSGMISIRIFDVRGRIVRWLANNEPAASCGSMAWDGRDERRRKVPIGVYVVLLEYWSDGREFSDLRTVVVVAGRL